MAKACFQSTSDSFLIHTHAKGNSSRNALDPIKKKIFVNFLPIRDRHSCMIKRALKTVVLQFSSYFFTTVSSQAVDNGRSAKFVIGSVGGDFYESSDFFQIIDNRFTLLVHLHEKILSIKGSYHNLRVSQFQTFADVLTNMFFRGSITSQK